MEDRYTETHQTWDHIAQLYEDKFMYLDLYDDTYQTFCDSLAIENASVLELGCGPGNITKHLLRLKPDLQILATDVSEQMIIRASKNNPGINARILDCRNLESIHQKFDGIMCGFTIPYLSKSDCKHLIYNCHQLLRENGILYLSFVPGDYTKSGFISGSTGERTYFYYHDTNILKQTLESNYMTVSHQIEKIYPKSDGTLETHVILIAQKNINI
ncbi:class I SAM-dependent methyltransferase [bacterium SCSIO 12643]|nr:class I SAM-dependent methyltransferase [bacterium SCSIO 12643]